MTDTPAPRKKGRSQTQLQSKLDLTQGIQRHRKQLRIAQQAYRKRKETTIVNLQARVQERESGIEELSESFLSFSNLLFEAGILENQPRQCVSLAKSCCDEAEQASAAPADISPSTSPTLSDTQDIISNYNPLPTQLDSLPIIGDAFQYSSDLAAQWPGLSQLPPTPPYQGQAILPFGIGLSPPNISFSSIPGPSLNFPTTVSPEDLLKQGSWTLSHRLVQQCCDIGYHLLTSSSGDNPRVKAIFGKRLTVDERNRLISGFFAVMHDEIGDTIELRTTVLNSRRKSYSSEQLAVSSRTWQIVIKSGADEWMDASGVQRLLQERGICIHDPSLPWSSPRSNSAPQLNAASFIKSFRKRDVENAIRLASLDGPWAFNAVCEIL
ncbi:hypothetical protein BDV38DRAFT_295978 [Aspergillus pseudotamarii]|uniref:BZIP domain-containing protein n=1 Tax=Aspergillus pseudotamarii TaxID=132259 RepID=A0A5N6SJM4_ASPPS|nr:uncharacterized protein BDV38DRAFT_295978 [Aspergillus pseudotamarii]KAE8133583.1 hypothetical protein BDV38DRAFT_295978 [Aspergillus pseudotamarii]